MIAKWTAQGSMIIIGGGHARPQVPTGGVGEDQLNNQKTNTRDLARQWAIGPANCIVWEESGFVSEISDLDVFRYTLLDE